MDGVVTQFKFSCSSIRIKSLNILFPVSVNQYADCFSHFLVGVYGFIASVHVLEQIPTVCKAFMVTFQYCPNLIFLILFELIPCFLTHFFQQFE